MRNGDGESMGSFKKRETAADASRLALTGGGDVGLMAEITHTPLTYRIQLLGLLDRYGEAKAAFWRGGPRLIVCGVPVIVGDQEKYPGDRIKLMTYETQWFLLVAPSLLAVRTPTS